MWLQNATQTLDRVRELRSVAALLRREVVNGVRTLLLPVKLVAAMEVVETALEMATVSLLRFATVVHLGVAVASLSRPGDVLTLRVPLATMPLPLVMPEVLAAVEKLAPKRAVATKIVKRMTEVVAVVVVVAVIHLK